jgi:hypothetical protein
MNLTDFLGREFVPTDGASVPFTAFVERFHHFLFTNGVDPTTWPRKRIRTALEAEGFCCGRAGAGICIGNIQDSSKVVRWVREPGTTAILKLQPANK